MSNVSDAPGRVDIDALVTLMRGRRAVVLAGAGCSTESGIPDYRGPEGRLKTRKPIQYGEFVRSAASRRRYWARSTVGWQRVAEAAPNAAHRALAQLEERALVAGVITQNVDGLHQAAGSRRVIELHGSLAQVVCLTCDTRTLRNDLQRRLIASNPDWLMSLQRSRTARHPESAPDGDAELNHDAYESFVVPGCEECGGVMKPDVVFFGENVPRERVAECWTLLDRSEVLLVVGSSLTVYSGRRFVYGANERGIPIGIVNLGPTRADEFAVAKVEGRLGSVIPRLAEALEPAHT